MLAKDVAGQTVKVARGLHDLSEMEGVKVILSLSLSPIIFWNMKCRVIFSTVSRWLSKFYLFGIGRHS